jgi:hypothetical protein
MNFSKNKNNGYIALVGVTLLGAAIVVALLTVGLSVRTGSKLTLNTKNSERSYFLSQACAEEALQKIWENNEYLGNEILTFNQGICGILPIEDGVDGEKTIKVYGEVLNHTKRSIITITTTTPQIIINNWVEVVDFE